MSKVYLVKVETTKKDKYTTRHDFKTKKEVVLCEGSVNKTL